MPSSATATRRFGALVIAAGVALLTSSSLQAGTQTLALTGDALPGSSAVKLQGVASASVNDSGQIAFLATLQHGIGGVTSDNDRAVWRKTGAVGSTLARTGVGALPGGGTLSTIQSASISNSGSILLTGAAGAVEGIWRFPLGAAGELVASTNGAPAVGVPGATVADLGVSALYSSAGVAAYHGDLQAAPLVSTTNNHCIWLDDSNTQWLAVREGVTPAPQSDGLLFANINPTAVNNSSQVALLGALPATSGGGTQTSLGIWRVGLGEGQLVARVQNEGVGDVPSASYSALGDPTINGPGDVAFRGTLALFAGISESNRYGIWLHDGEASHAVARAGSQPPGLSGAKFADFGDPLLNDNENALFQATLAVGIGGVSSANAQGLWKMSVDGGSLLARTGSGGVPGLPGASFAGFGATAFNGGDVAAVEATLLPGVGGVTAANSKGLWLMSAAGSGELVARSGDTLAGRVIEDLSFTGGSGGNDGRLRSLNESGQLVFKAVFTNGDEGLFLYTPATGQSIADFTGDGVVNSSDLVRWRTNFGAASAASHSQGDADSDGDVDGNDLLLWQQQLGQTGVTAVPEAGFAALVLPGWMLFVLRLNRGARPLRHA